MFIAMLGLVSLAFGFSSYRISRRVTRGRQGTSSRPLLRYLGSFLLATTFAWSIHVIGTACALLGVPLLVVLPTFFAPTWFLLFLSMPTLRRLEAWAEAGSE